MLWNQWRAIWEGAMMMPMIWEQNKKPDSHKDFALPLRKDTQMSTTNLLRYVCLSVCVCVCVWLRRKSATCRKQFLYFTRYAGVFSTKLFAHSKWTDRKKKEISWTFFLVFTSLYSLSSLYTSRYIKTNFTQKEIYSWIFFRSVSKLYLFSIWFLFGLGFFIRSPNNFFLTLLCHHFNHTVRLLLSDYHRTLYIMDLLHVLPVRWAECRHLYVPHIDSDKNSANFTSTQMQC